MTLNDRYHLLLADFATALNGFEVAVQQDLSSFNATIQDLIKNGQIQKFEVCAELAWKTAKFYLENELGEIVASPKQVYKTMFTSNIITENILSDLLLVVDDRNLLSHVYKEEFFVTLIKKLPDHFDTLKNLYERIK